MKEEPTYDIVDSEGNMIATAAEQIAEATNAVLEQKELNNILSEKPKTLSEGELKKLRKVYVTVAHPKVKGCGHSLDLNRQPVHRNCEHCWFSWFSNHKEIVEQCDEMFKADNGKLMTQLQGVTFTKRFTQFMATLAQWKQESEVQNV